MKKSGHNYLTDKCGFEGCDKKTLNAAGRCKEHRKSVCRKCDRKFTPHFTGERICSTCKSKTKNIGVGAMF